MAIRGMRNPHFCINFMFFDLVLFERVILRYLWPIKSRSVSYVYAQPFLKSLLLYFPVRDLELLDHPKIFNYVYLFAFFFGRRALIKNYNSLFNLGRYYFSFDVIICFNNNNTIPMALTTVVYELQPYLNLKLTTNYNFSSRNIFS